jgi:hypothetical protein
MNEERIPKKVLNMEVKGICPKRGLQSSWEQIRKDVTQKERRKNMVKLMR